MDLLKLHVHGFHMGVGSFPRLNQQNKKAHPPIITQKSNLMVSLYSTSNLRKSTQGKNMIDHLRIAKRAPQIRKASITYNG